MEKNRAWPSRSASSGSCTWAGVRMRANFKKCCTQFRHLVANVRNLSGHASVSRRAEARATRTPSAEASRVKVGEGWRAALLRGVGGVGWDTGHPRCSISYVSHGATIIHPPSSHQPHHVPKPHTRAPPLHPHPTHPTPIASAGTDPQIPPARTPPAQNMPCSCDSTHPPTHLDCLAAQLARVHKASRPAEADKVLDVERPAQALPQQHRVTADLRGGWIWRESCGGAVLSLAGGLQAAPSCPVVPSAYSPECPTQASEQGQTTNEGKEAKPKHQMQQPVAVHIKQA